MKKIYFLFLLALLPLVASADAVKIGSIYYNLNAEAKTAEVTSNPNKYTGEVVIPKTVTYQSVKYKVTYICNFAFYECSGLTSVTIPNSVTSIGNAVFYCCNNLTSITIPSSVTSIGDAAFAATPWYENQPDGAVYAGKVFYRYKGTMPEGTKISIIDGTLGIASHAFYNCSGLTSVTIPNTVTNIGIRAFSGCSGLKTITIPNSVSLILSSAFDGCSQLTDICCLAEDAPFVIGAFEDSNYENVTLHVPAGSVDTYKATEPWSNFTNIVAMLNVGDTFECSIDGAACSFRLNDVNKVTLTKSDMKGKVVIPPTVTYEGVEYTITAITGSWYFGQYESEYSSVFNYPNSISEVVIPNSVTRIGEATFYCCSNLTSVTIPSSVTVIGQVVGHTFAGCNNLTSVHITDLEAWCKTSLYDNLPAHHLYLNGKEIKKLVIPSSVTSIGKYAFSGCIGLTSVTIPNSVTVIDWLAFYGCSGLTSVTIPNSVTSIGENAFSGCIGLTSVTIGNGVTSISGYAFAECPQLTDVYCYAESVPDTDETAFQSSNITNATLHVPAGSVEAYKAADPWSQFGSKVKITSTVKLNKTKATIEKTKTLTLKATVTPSDLLDKSVTWKSSNTAVATVTSKGKVTGVKAGTATITCTSTVSGAKATCKVTVGYVKLDQTEAVVKKGKTLTLTPTVFPSSLTDKSVTWESSNTKVATVTSAGKVKGVKAGTATIKCTSVATGLSTTCQVTVGYVKLDQTEVSIVKGKTVTLTPTVYPSSLEDKNVTWTSSNTAVATVSSTGKVKGVKYGTAIITCTSNATGLSTTCQVTVGKVIISMSEFTLKKSRTTVLTATVYPSTLTDKSVVWESSNTEIATISSDGKVKGIKAGTATITCTSVATGLSGTCKVTVLSTTGSRSTETNGDDGVTGIENLENAPAPAEPYDVYDLSGRKVRHQVNSLDGLPDGIYIVNGRKILKNK